VKIEDAETLARSLMSQHGLASWHIVWRPWVLIAGKCVRPLHWLVFSRPIVELNEEPTVAEIVLHEVAHALTDGQHDEAWRAVAKRLGCRQTDGMVVEVPRYPESYVITEEEAKMLSWRRA